MLGDLLATAKSARIHVKPPGHYGAVAIVASTQGVSTQSLFPSSFVTGNGQLGTRAAISAATLAQDDSDETRTVITSLLDGFAENPGGVSAVSIVLSLWSSLLGAYCNGQDVIEAGVRDALGKIPFASASGLGTWASNRMEKMIQEAGLESAELYAYKPVLVNSAHVLQADSGSFSQAMLDVKMVYVNVPATGSPMAGALGAVQPLVEDQAVAAEEKFVVATVELLGIDSESLPFSIALPPSAKQATASGIDAVFARLQGLASNVGGVRQWQ